MIVDKLRYFRTLRKIKNKIIHTRILGEMNLPIPNALVFEVTPRCNLDCKMCYYTKEGKELSLESIHLIFADKLKPFHFKSCYIAGAEPFMRDDLKEICKIINDQNIEVTVQTNGTFITEPLLRELKPFISRIDVSVDGLPETHNAIRGMQGAFNKTIDGIKICQKLGIDVIVNTLILNENLEELEELIALLATLEIKNIDLSLVMHSNEDEIAVTSKISGLEESEIYTAKSDALLYKESQAKIKERISCILKSHDFVTISPSILVSDFNALYDGTIREYRKLSCCAFWNVRIAPDGSIIHCPIIRKSFGNLQETPLREIWNSGEFREFRKTLLLNNLLPICKRCCKIRFRELKSQLSVSGGRLSQTVNRKPKTVNRKPKEILCYSILLR